MLDGKFKLEKVERVKKMSISIVVRFAGFVVVENGELRIESVGRIS